jgi:DNA-binding beta-propeller fold protein YncE
VFNPAGSFFSSDTGGFVREVDMSGTLLGWFALPFRGGAIAFDGSRLFVGDLDAPQVVVIDTSGNILDSFAAGAGALRPEGMVFDPSTGTLWVITLFGSELYEMNTAGQVLRSCETAFTPGPFGLGGITLVGSTFYIAEPAGGDPFAGTHVFAIERDALQCNPPLVKTVLLDVKPGESPNMVKVNSAGTIPVAILTTPDFDAATVDATTLRFGPTGTEAAPAKYSLEDADGDGDLDLVAHFQTSATGLSCFSTMVAITGTTYGGKPIAGSDSMEAVGCK